MTTASSGSPALPQLGQLKRHSTPVHFQTAPAGSQPVSKPHSGGMLPKTDLATGPQAPRYHHTTLQTALGMRSWDGFCHWPSCPALAGVPEKRLFLPGDGLSGLPHHISLFRAHQSGRVMGCQEQTQTLRALVPSWSDPQKL